MKSILVPLEDCPSLRAQLETALLVARRFSSHIDGIAPRAVFNTYALGEGVSAAATTLLDNVEQEEAARSERARAEYRALMRERDVSWGDPLKPSDKPTAELLGEPEAGDEVIGQLARLYDLAVLARPLPKAAVPRPALLETVLFESGRPIMVAPPQATSQLGEVVLVAWNGSTESARSLTFAQPFLAQAKRVIVLSVEGGSVPGPSAPDITASLKRSGVAAETSQIRPDGRSVGEAILAEAAKQKADLLIKGAYTHSRLRQMIFGGATSHILAEAEIPVLMAH